MRGGFFGGSGIDPSSVEFGFWFSNIASAVFYVDKCIGDMKFFFVIQVFCLYTNHAARASQIKIPFSYRHIRIGSRLGTPLVIIDRCI